MGCSTNVILIYDQNDKIVEANHQVKEHFNVDAKSVIGSKITALPFIDYSTDRSKAFFSIRDTSNITEFEQIDGQDRYKNKIIFEAKMKRADGRGVIIIKDLPGADKAGNLSSGMKFLSEASLKLLEKMSEDDIYQYIANQLAYLIPDSYVFVNSQLTQTRVKTIASATSSTVLGRGFKVIGGSPVGKEFEFSKKAEFTSKQAKVTRVAGGIYELMLGQMPKSVAMMAEKVVSIKNVYSIGFFWKGELFGNAAIITRQAEEHLENEGTIETFINLASVALQRKKIETQLEQTFNNLREEKEKIKTILFSIGDGVVVIDNNMQIILFNETASRISDFKVEDVIGKEFREHLEFITEETSQDASQFIVKCIQSGEITKMPKGTVLKTRSGELVPVDDTAAPLKNNKGEVVGCVVVFRNVTEERSIDKAKTEFVSLASHQLKTPLASINWYSDLLISDKKGQLSENQRDYMNEIVGSSKRMVDLVNSLLNVSRIELGTFVIEPEKVDMKAVAKSIIAELAPMIEKKKIKISEKYEGVKEIPLDQKLIRIIFQNLLSNAVKYTPDKGSVDLSISEKNKNYLITVKDSGYGIPKQEQVKIFTKLYRANNVKDKDVEGTGLGLYIVKSIIENSGGKIWFESELNKGTSFFVEIPVSGMKKKDGSRQLS